MDGKSVRPSGAEIDEARERQIAYQYLCHLQEAKLWLEKVLRLALPPVAELEENFRNGVVLAKLGHFVTPEVVPLGSIYDTGEKRYKAIGLSFRHTENINLFLRALQRSGFPRIFLPEVPDIFEKKNIPKLIYCLHALSAHLFRLGLAPPIQDLFGKVEFSDATISNVCKDLKDSCVNMPTFQKIGGLLSGDINENKFVNTIAAVNDAVDQQSSRNLLVALTDPLLRLTDVKTENIEEYLSRLSHAKKEKCNSSLNKSLNGSLEVDPDSDCLSQPEIQGFIKIVNVYVLWKQICKAVNSDDDTELRKVLMDNMDEFGTMFEVNNVEYYMESFKISVADAVAIGDSERDIIINAIESGNNHAEHESLVRTTLGRLCSALKSDDCFQVLNILNEPCLGVQSEISNCALYLYFSELKELYTTNKNVTVADVKGCINAMNYVQAVTSAVDSKDVDQTWSALCALDAHLCGFLELPENPDRDVRTDYYNALESARTLKLEEENDILTWEEIQYCVELVKADEEKRNQDLALIHDINEAVLASDQTALGGILKKLMYTFQDEDSSLYLSLLRVQLEDKEKNGQELWLSDVITAADQIPAYRGAAEHLILLLKDIKTTVEEGDYAQLVEMLEAEGVVCPVSGERLLTTLASFLNEGNSDIVEEKLGRLAVYLNLQKGVYTFECPLGFSKSKSQFCLRLIKVAMTVKASDVQDKYACQRQDCTRNLLKEESDCIRNLLDEQSACNEKMEQAVICIQAYIRGMLVRLSVQKKVEASIRIQRWWRRMNSRIQTPGLRNLDYYLQHTNEIKTIQQCWRRRQQKKRKASGKISPSPPESKAKMELAFEHDATEGLIQKLRIQVVESIKRNQELAKKVEDMDIKIGLLVRNRISIASLLSERRNQKAVPVNDAKGIKALSKEARSLLDGYQKLFYLLQTRPAYLSRLICRSPANHTIQSCVFNLFNHGSSPRDEYLLLRLFEHALNEEVDTKFQTPFDAVRGNPLVLKLAVGFARQGAGQHPLKYILSPLIYQLLEEKVTLDTNPVDIYRRWINETEVKSGCQISLPRCVSQEVALQSPEVAQRLETNIKLLQMWVTKFLKRLVENANRLPFTLKFIAKTLHDALFRKFPHLTEKDVLKVVGHLIYYRYVNSALVAPDAFHIISLPVEKPLKAEQRKNLATIAKILQFSASKTGFGEESRHLMQLNPFIIDCHDVMKNISQDCCAVPSLEENYHINEYSEAAMMQRPKVYMKASELCEAHNLLLERRTSIAPNPTDPLHELLLDLGAAPTPASLLGYSGDASSHVEKALICLDLDNQYISEEDQVHKKSKSYMEAELKLRREAQTKELHEIKTTLSRLQAKTKHFEEQLVCYEKYLDTCLSNHTLSRKSKATKTLKYTGAQLMEKGILVTLNSVPANQHKNLQFEISSTANSGIFHIRCRFMGVEVDSTEIDIQHLLSLQFEGCGVMNMFGKAEINVNLLIFLLNKKFGTVRKSLSVRGKKQK